MLLTDALSGLLSPANSTIELDMGIDHHGFMTERIRQISAETATDPALARMDGQFAETEFHTSQDSIGTRGMNSVQMMDS